MKFLSILLLAGASLATFCAHSSAAAVAAVTAGEVVVVPLEGAVSKAQTAFLRRTLKQAETDRASAYVIEMNTPGGELDAAVDILQLLLKARVPTYTWVNTNAGSAGALIALGSDHVYMAPVSAIGAAAPVASGGAEIPETMTSKILSYYSGYFRSAAQAKGRNPTLAAAFIDKDTEFNIGDEVISEKGKLLTLSAQEAVRVFDGRPLLADGIADSLDQLKREAKLTGPTVRLEPSGFERVAQWITLLAPLFLVGGIAAAYLEFKAPGFGVAGFVSLLCFAIFFLGHYVAGLAGLEVLGVFLLGAALFVAELVFFPGIFVAAALGLAFMVGSVFFAMVDHFPGDPVIPSAEMLVRPTVNLAVTAALAVLVVALLARFFPSLPFFRRLVLPAAIPYGPSLAAPASAQAGRPGQRVQRSAVRPGMTGRARSVLRPSGQAEIDGAFVDVVTDGEFLEAGTAVRVLQVEGSRVLVGPA